MIILTLPIWTLHPSKARIRCNISLLQKLMMLLTGPDTLKISTYIISSRLLLHVRGGLNHGFLSKNKNFLYTQVFSTVIWYVKSE